MIAVVAAVLVGVSACCAKVIYVDADATGASNGLSWEDAYVYLRDALADANASPKPIEIRVAQGAYTPDTDSTFPDGTGDRQATFHLMNGVSLKGGYAGSGQPGPNVRDVNKYETVLSGDLNADDIALSDPGDLVDESSRVENCYHVVTALAIDASAVLDGFTITGGNANLEWEHESGGGMIINSGDPIIRNCTFRRNSACTYERGHGGGLANDGGNPTLLACRFIENVADTGIRAHGGGNGGGMASHGVASLVDCVFIRNLAAGNDGGAMYLSEGHTLTHCLFVENSARMHGGAIYSYEEITLAGCRFIGNEAVRGNAGAMHTILGLASLSKCDFIRNRAGDGGGALNLGSQAKFLANCLFVGNVAAGSGGGILIWPTGDRELTNCTFAGNRASAGRSLASGSHDDYFSSIRLTNCVLWNGGDEIANRDGSAMNITYTSLQGGQGSIHDPYNTVVFGVGNVNTAPCFADAGHWDLNRTPDDPNDDSWVTGDYHLKSQAGRWDPNSRNWVLDGVTSPCIDAGDPNSPIGYEPFPNGGRINMGAYGGTEEASKSYFGKTPCATIIAGDINGDCKVDLVDLGLLASHWLETHQ